MASRAKNKLGSGRQDQEARETWRLGVRNLEGEAVFSLFLPHLGPPLMNGAFVIVGRGFGAFEFDGVNAAEVLDLVAFGFQPDILDAGNFSGPFLDAIDGFFPVIIRASVSEFVHHYV